MIIRNACFFGQCCFLKRGFKVPDGNMSPAVAARDNVRLVVCESVNATVSVARNNFSASALQGPTISSIFAVSQHSFTANICAPVNLDLATYETDEDFITVDFQRCCDLINFRIQLNVAFPWLQTRNSCSGSRVEYRAEGFWYLRRGQVHRWRAVLGIV